ncbi:DUF4917 family protein [Amycolatopsis speibonae]|uniref:DUF4917 family protein n=1 Tax=Amycolatopsis speibonae TaxID=1450224 RepID=A0ABV7P0V1_9PSEU
MRTAVDDDLQDWRTLDDREWLTLLIGNGLSINLWGDFAYPRLFDKATLSAQAKNIFAELETTDFEKTLECLYHARIVLEALGQGTSQVDTVYAEVRDALFGAVADVQANWNRFSTDARTKIAETLAKYRSTYTTNYDLCLYFARIHYLHGGIHLWKSDKSQLFVSEGTFKAKIRTIQRSPYPRSCLESLAANE